MYQRKSDKRKIDMTKTVRLWILKQVAPLMVISLFSGISAAAEVESGPANFVLSMSNTSGSAHTLNGPASEGVVIAPAYNCAVVTSKGFTGPFRFENIPPGSAQYAFNSSQLCESTNNDIEFVLTNNQSNTSCYRKDWINNRLFNTNGVNICLFWKINDPAFALGIYSGTDEDSKLPKISLVLERKQSF